ncbi:MAG: DUF4834 family protein [Tannerellaceae bacterium]|nr:DUF4834 family protein [Tannerellaceae bacterium]MCD8177233.1 DUF4834 family protein [Tannerellaceae bacterium]
MIKFIIFCVGFVILLGFLLGFSVLRMFKYILFGSSSNRREEPGRKRTQTNSKQQYTAPKKKKIIEKDEGEYVEYEEV